MSHKTEAIKQVAKDLKDDFDNWLNDLEEQQQPEACNIDDPSCDTCGS